jgi:hypothetical protein
MRFRSRLPRSRKYWKWRKERSSSWRRISDGSMTTNIGEKEKSPIATKSIREEADQEVTQKSEEAGRSRSTVTIKIMK